MTTRITQLEGQNGTGATLKVEGIMSQADAELLAQICTELQAQPDRTVTIDLAGTTFLDSESAAILCRLGKEGAQLTGLHLFVQQLLELTERNGTN